MDIAVFENDIETIRKMTFEFAFDHSFSKEYYHQWKQTYSDIEWIEVIESHISDTIKKVTDEHNRRKMTWGGSHNLSLLYELAPVYIEEEYWYRLLDLVKTDADLNSILRYHRYLVEKYPKELLELYIFAFMQSGKNTSDRRAYAELASNMKMVIKDILEGKDDICAVVQQIIKENPHRLAMIEELKNVLLKQEKKSKPISNPK